MHLHRASQAAAILTATLVFTASVRAADRTIDDEFFEKKIRPVLIDHCYKCHSAKSEKIKGKLRVDSRAALLKGGDTGPALVPGKIEKSLFAEAILYTNHDLQMPPSGKLPKQVINDLLAWLSVDAPWPNEPGQAAALQEKLVDYEKLKKEHWAFQPIKKPTPPTVRVGTVTPIDSFIMAQIEQRNLRPAYHPEPRTLLRRLSFDLTGLPPTPEEIDAFLKDKSPDAYEKTVDRLLASPHFGERWGRHWLDIARYAETAGGGRIVPLANAWRYRDYVIDAFNKDKPYDQFITEQLAGDLMTAADQAQRHNQIIATGFLAVGAKNLDTQDKDLLRLDVVDEQIDTVGKAMLGMTTGCARCHDHKFDPIPTRDYYALAGIFRSTKSVTAGNVSGSVQTVLPDPAIQQKVDESDKKIAALEAKYLAIRAATSPKKPSTPAAASKEKSKPAAPKAKIETASLQGIVIDDAQANIAGPWIKSTYVAPYVGEGYIHDNNKGKGELSVSFAPSIPKAGVYEVRLSYTTGPSRAERVPVIVQHAEGERTIDLNQRLEPPINGLFVSLGRFNFQMGNDGSVTISNTGTKGHVTVDAVQFIPAEELAQEPRPQAIVNAQEPRPQGSGNTPPAKSAFDDEQAQLKQIEKEIADLKKNAPTGPSALAVRDEEQVEDCNIRLRGEVHRLGERVPRGFLSAVPCAAPPVTGKTSGRIELARWITDPSNPLTSRVMANRIWQHLFGAGIVRTTDNFGVTGEPPSHPELLDYLATRFVESGWSSKKLIREVVLSRTYRQAVAANVDASRADPENRLLWRANRRRLSAEAIRDAMLLNSGELELSGSPGAGPAKSEKAEKNEKPEKSKKLCRTVYVPVEREQLDDLLEVFDFADSNLVVGNRNSSNIPTQALFLMNSPFVVERAKKAAQRLLDVPGLDDTARLNLAYDRALGRLPTDAEKKLALDFLNGTSDNKPQEPRPQGSGKDSAAKWGQLYQTLFACVDFRYAD